MNKHTKIYVLIIFIQIIIMFSLDKYLDTQIGNAISKDMNQYEFSDTLLQMFSNLNTFRLLEIASVFIINVLLLLVVKPILDKKLHVFFLIALVLMAEPAQLLYSLMNNNEHYNIEKILVAREGNLNSLKMKTYLYHHFKNKGDQAGIDLVLKYAKRNVQPSEADFLITYRKDKEYPQLFKQ